MNNLGQITTVSAPLQTTQEGGLLSTVTANTLNPSQTLTYLNTTQEVIGTKVFSKKVLPKVGQPYSLQMSDSDVLREVYGSIPSTVKIKPSPGNEPQRIIRLRNGLDVPQDILERDALRKKAAEREAELLLSIKPGKLLQIGHFASKNPMQASLIALAVGAIAGSIFYDKTN